MSLPHRGGLKGIFEMNGTITDWGAAVMTSLTAALSLFLAAIPRIIGFIVILIIGWLIGVFAYSATGLIHILIVIAVIALLLAIIRRA